VAEGYAARGSLASKRCATSNDILKDHNHLGIRHLRLQSFDWKTGTILDFAFVLYGRFRDFEVSEPYPETLKRDQMATVSTASLRA